MEKEIIDGWHRNCAEDLPEMGEYVMCVFQEIDDDGNFVPTEEPPMQLNCRTDDDEFEVEQNGWINLFEDCRVRYWFRIPSVPEKYIGELMSDIA